MNMLRCLVTVLLSAMVCSAGMAQSAQPAPSAQSTQPAQPDQSTQSAQPTQSESTSNPLDSIDQLLSEPEASNDRGFSWFTTVTGSHDSFSGWSSVVDCSMRYDFSSVFGVELGMPYYITHNGYKSTISARSTVRPHLASSYNSLGDLYLRLHFAAPETSFHYAAELTGTAPTGDTSSGISTGRPTFDLNNHIEHSFGFFTPMAEFGIGDSSALIDQSIGVPYASLLGRGASASSVALINQQIRQPYTTLGAISHYRAGGTFDFLKIFSLTLSGYEDLPIGSQKVYSHLFVPSKTGKQIQIINGKKFRGFESVREVRGQGILEDNGLAAEMFISINRHLALVGTYQHSLRQRYDAVAFGMSFALGKYARKPEDQ